MSDEPEVDRVGVEGRPDLIETPTGPDDEGKLAALMRLILDHADPTDRAVAMAHPGLGLRPRGEGMLEVVLAHDGRVLGTIEARDLQPRSRPASELTAGAESIS